MRKCSFLIARHGKNTFYDVTMAHIIALSRVCWFKHVCHFLIQILKLISYCVGHTIHFRGGGMGEKWVRVGIRRWEEGQWAGGGERRTGMGIERFFLFVFFKQPTKIKHGYQVSSKWNMFIYNVCKIVKTGTTRFKILISDFYSFHISLDIFFFQIVVGVVYES